MVKELLEVRKKIKSRKPKFRRQQSNQYAKFKNSNSWRKPKGSGSKMRLRQKGHRKMPTVGFSSPSSIRGFNKDGFREVLVFKVSDLQNVNLKEDIVVISQNVGKRKKIIILEECKKLKLKVFRVPDIDLKIKELTKEKSLKKETKGKKTDVKKDKEVLKEKSTKATKQEVKDNKKTVTSKEEKGGAKK
ncbi:MAG: eL32 family ribosomal protein [Nanoarchaeota archaeon]